MPRTTAHEPQPDPRDGEPTLDDLLLTTLTESGKPDSEK